MLHQTFEVAIRKKDADYLVRVLEDYIEMKKGPPDFLLQKISMVRDLPDRLFVLLKDHFPKFGLILK